MKKIIISIISSFFLLIGSANAVGLSLGGSIAAGVFSVDGATEKNADATINAVDENEDAEGLYAIGSVFAEVSLNDKISVGIDYVPHALESNQVTNAKEGNVTGVDVTNTVEVHVEDITTAYVSLSLTDSIYAKAGYIQADVITNEILQTGGAYPNADIDGYVLGLGMDRDLDSGLFVRLEASYTDLDSVSVTNTNDSTKSVTVDGVQGYGAKLSIGKSF